MSPSRLTSVSVGLPWGLGSVEVAVSDEIRRAAWDLYVELQTRIAVQPLDHDEGLVREAIDSLYGLFATTRQILREGGPVLGVSEDTVGGIAMRALNGGLRPFLSKWHPELATWENQRSTTTSPRDHEQGWEHAKAVRGHLDTLRAELREYAAALARISEAD